MWRSPGLGMCFCSVLNVHHLRPRRLWVKSISRLPRSGHAERGTMGESEGFSSGVERVRHNLAGRQKRNNRVAVCDAGRDGTIISVDSLLCFVWGCSRAREIDNFDVGRRVVVLGWNITPRVVLGPVWLFEKCRRESRARSSTRGQKGREAAAPGLSLGALRRAVRCLAGNFSTT